MGQIYQIILNKSATCNMATTFHILTYLIQTGIQYVLSCYIKLYLIFKTDFFFRCLNFTAGEFAAILYFHNLVQFSF